MLYFRVWALRLILLEWIWATSRTRQWVDPSNTLMFRWVFCFSQGTCMYSQSGWWYLRFPFLHGGYYRLLLSLEGGDHGKTKFSCFSFTSPAGDIRDFFYRLKEMIMQRSFFFRSPIGNTKDLLLEGNDYGKTKVRLSALTFCAKKKAVLLPSTYSQTIICWLQILIAGFECFVCFEIFLEILMGICCCFRSAALVCLDILSCVCWITMETSTTPVCIASVYMACPATRHQVYCLVLTT